MKYKIGDKVKFTHAYVREFREPNIKEWVSKPVKHPDVIQDGFIVGVRNLSNGIIEQNYDEPTIYRPNIWFSALLVVTDLRKKPFLVKLKQP